MASRLALSIAPILILALSHQAQAQTEPHNTGHSNHHQTARLSSARPGRPRFAMLGRRHNRQISFRHLAIRHVDSRQVVHSANNYGVALTNGWNPAEAGMSVVVTITDRLYSRHRIIDLSEGAAEQLGILHDGLAMVMLTPEN